MRKRKTVRQPDGGVLVTYTRRYGGNAYRFDQIDYRGVRVINVRDIYRTGEIVHRFVYPTPQPAGN